MKACNLQVMLKSRSPAGTTHQKINSRAGIFKTDGKGIGNGDGLSFWDWLHVLMILQVPDAGLEVYLNLETVRHGNLPSWLSSEGHFG